MSAGPADLMGHSRGGHIVFRVAQARPDLLCKAIFSEPGGDLEPSAADESVSRPRAVGAARTGRGGDGAKWRHRRSARPLHRWDRCRGAWARWPAAARQQLRDNIYTLLGQLGENRKPFLKSEAESIKIPTLLMGGGDTKGALAVIWRVLAGHIPGARTAVIPGTPHWMFEQAPREFCDVALEFLKV